MVETFQRQPAIKKPIGSLLQGTFTPGKDGSPGSFALVDGLLIDRVNVVGTILHKEQIGTITNLLLDDGTGKIIVRLFEEVKNGVAATVGVALLVIGKVREYNQEKYLSPEIIKVVHPEWLKVRSLELGLKMGWITAPVPEKASDSHQEKQRVKNNSPTVLEEEDIVEEKETLLPNQKLLHLIKELDPGSGALIEEIIEKSPLQDTEAMLQKMLEKGDIFQISPGKVKVL